LLHIDFDVFAVQLSIPNEIQFSLQERFVIADELAKLQAIKGVLVPSHLEDGGYISTMGIRPRTLVLVID